MAELNTTAPNLTLPGQNFIPNAPGLATALPNPLTQTAASLPNQSPVDLSALSQALNSNQKTEEEKPETNLNEQVSHFQNFNRNLVSIGELFATLPFVLSGFVNQAESISKYGSIVKSANSVSLISHIISVLSSPARKFINELVSHREDEHDVKELNSKTGLVSEFFSRNIPYPLRRLSHPILSKEFTSLLFTFRRVIFNIFPDTFTVPSDERDVDKNKRKWGSTASPFAKTAFEASARVLSPFRWVSTIMAAVSSVPSNLFGLIFAYNGNQGLYNISREFSKLSELFTPIVSNLSSLYSSAKAFIDSYTRPNKESLSVSFGRYNISYLHVLQGSIGSLLSIPYFFGIFSRFKDVLSTKDQNDRYHFVNHVRELVGECAPQIKSLGLFKNDSISRMQDKVGEFTHKSIVGVNKYSKQVLEAFFNSSSFLKSIFKQVRPLDKDGRVLASTGPNTFESDQPADNYFLGLNRKIFFKEVFDLLHPIQSLLMLLPNAFVPLNDPYVADNATRGLKILDRLFGINSMVLSVPNYFIYALSTRLPQLILKVNQIIYRMHEAKGMHYDPNQAWNKTIAYIKRIPSFGLSTYLAEMLEKHLPKEINEYTFIDDEEMANLLEKIEEDARAQEASVKTSELVGAMRIGMRTLLGKGWFYAQRNQETGYTDEEQSSMNIYKSLGTFKEGIYKFPVIGWIAGPFIEMLRRLYYVAPRTDLKRLARV